MHPPTCELMGTAPTTIDLFAGAGGLSLGFHFAGFAPRLATDFDAAAAATYRHNFPGTAFLQKPIEEVPTKALLEAASVAEGEVDVMLGGPPCQAFSVYNHQRGFHDSRSGLFREYLRLVQGIMPKVIVIENVVGMTSLGDGRAVEEIHTELSRLGYEVEHRILEAERFGVPQERRRLFFLASRVGPLCWPDPSHGRPDDLFSRSLKPLVTVADALSDLPALRLGEGVDDPVSYAGRGKGAYQRWARAGSPGAMNHVAPSLGAINLERMRFIPPGGSWRDIPERLLPAGMKRAKRSDHTKRYGRLHPDGLASTILTKCDLHWGAYIHPAQDRTLTVREAARFQSFPDRFRFLGSRVEQYKQVGNAVPPLLAAAVAGAVRRTIEAAQRMSESARAS